MSISDLSPTDPRRVSRKSTTSIIASATDVVLRQAFPLGGERHGFEVWSLLASEWRDTETRSKATTTT
ncbi:hypothetical protein AB0C47_04975 [Micromonospora taraxaci]|uniref:hypothetical protein n=1 Tax=Micromonospora taraxaci TaxID=1316803 RepID=UPI0033D646F8